MHRYIKQAILTISTYSLMHFSFGYATTIDDLAHYRGTYELQLDNANDKSDVAGFTGRMVYEFSGNRCKGFTTKFRLVSKMDFNDLPQRTSDQQVVNIESENGKKFTFSNKNYTDQELTKEVNGIAELVDDKLKVIISKPENTTHILEKALFPTDHTLEIINSALEQNYMFNTDIFDGSYDADKITPSHVIIGKKITPQADLETKVIGQLANEPVWPVYISYFDDSENQDGLPTYSTSFFLYQNGITRNLTMDYGDFSITGKLVKLEFLEKDSKACETKN